MTAVDTHPTTAPARCRHCRVPVIVDDSDGDPRIVHADGRAFCDATERTRASLAGADLIFAAAGIGPTAPRCPGTGQLAFVPNERGVSLCTVCGQQIATEMSTPHGLPIYRLHVGERARRLCKTCGGPALPGERWCSARCHRADDPDAYCDEAFNADVHGDDEDRERF